MGGFISSRRRALKAKARSDAIDLQIEEDRRKYMRTCRILVLGSRDSGKTTIIKQMKIIHQGGFTDQELADYRPFIYKDVLNSAQAIVAYMRKMGMEYVDYDNCVCADKIMDYRLDDYYTSMSNPYFSPDIANAIHQMWQDPIIAKIMDEHSNELHLMDSAAYFFGEVMRIGTPGYLPTEMDVLRARHKSFGIMETRFSMGALSIHMFDIGVQPSERRKWIHRIEGVTSLIFCTALSEYDQVLLEEKSQTRMAESLVLFESVIASRWFVRASVILFLTKIDVFKAKLPKVPLENYFPEYTGGTDINKAAKYILWRFMQANRARLTVYPHLTQATDTATIRLVFAAVKETILQNALKDSGIL